MDKKSLYAQLNVETIGNVTILSGPAGCGKTTKAREIATQLAGPGGYLHTFVDRVAHPGGRISTLRLDRAIHDFDTIIIEECTEANTRFMSRHASTVPGKTFILVRRA